MAEVTPLLDRALEWARHDPDEGDRATVSGWAAAARDGDPAALAELTGAFAGPLAFGTAGLRGRLGPGESRMNRAVVVRTTAGLFTYLRDVAGAHPRVVIGFDARHGSAAFARDAAGVVAAAGGEALLLPGPLPTPVLAFAVRRLDADAGVMITASHNPPQDNGYKVYLGGRAAAGPARGVQIVPPADELIAAAIAAQPPADEVPRDASGVRRLGDEVVADYLRRAASLVTAVPSSRPLRIVLTPMHGVGGFVAERALLATGFVEMHVVAEQAAPDPDFPTLAFPNPEEPGALDLAIARARECDADLVVALDPDADRCSVAVPWEGVEGGWRRLTGDELGALLGEDLAAAHDREPEATLACSVVSSRLLAAIAERHGLRHATTLTGFKWIARVEGLVFGYEEAIGYCTDPEAVRDKDGITTAVRVAGLASRLAAQGRTLRDALDEIARTYGLYATAPATFRFDDLGLIADAMARLRAAPPATLAGARVTSVVDLADGMPALDLPPTDGMLLVTEADDRVVVRPSGTEPKLKGYLEVVFACGADGDVPRLEAGARLEGLRRDLTAVLGW